MSLTLPFCIPKKFVYVPYNGRPSCHPTTGIFCWLRYGPLASPAPLSARIANTFSSSTSFCAAVTLRAVSAASSSFTTVSLRAPSSFSALALAKRALMPSRMVENAADGPDVGTMLPILISVGVTPGSGLLQFFGSAMCCRFLNWPVGLPKLLPTSVLSLAAPAACTSPKLATTASAAPNATATRPIRRRSIVSPLCGCLRCCPTTAKGACGVARCEAYPMTDNPYSELPKVGPYEVRIGSALITMVEPNPGHERAYNRWYEDDHFYAGAMAMPWMFAGRRWVAPRHLQRLRYPADSAIAQPLNQGCYLSVYWITAGRYDDHIRWTVATNQRLGPDGRVYNDRTHVYTAFQSYDGCVYRDADGPRDIHALDYPFGGLVLEVVDAVGVDRDGLWSWLRDEHIPGVLRGSAVAMCLAFHPMPLPADRQSFVRDLPGLDRRLTLL